MTESLSIVIDTREGCPWSWPEHQVSCTICGLNAGDYALLSDTEVVKGRKTLAVRFAIERKELNDFLGTIAGGWERFNRELIRMESFPARIVIVEGTFEQCCFTGEGESFEPPDHNHDNLTPQFVARRIAELSLMGVSVIFAGDPQLAAGLAYKIFVRRHDMMRGL
jgi:ERCC4-type nuclease